MKTSNGLIFAALAIGVSAGVNFTPRSNIENCWNYKAPRGGRGHWQGSLNCKKASRARIKSRLAKQARKTHRK